LLLTDGQIYLATTGAAGKATLAGIDSDNDGVRDDVQRWIVMSYPNSEKTRAALQQMAKAMQNILLNATDVVNARAYSLEEDKASDCISYVRKQVLGARSSDAYNVKREMDAIYLNTYLRTKVYLQYDAHLSGMFFAVPIDKSTSCNFNVALMPN
jgi:hypothetical protein